MAAKYFACLIGATIAVGGFVYIINFVINGVLEAISNLASAAAKVLFVTAGTYALPSLYGSIYQANTVLAPVSQIPLGYGELASVFIMIWVLAAYALDVPRQPRFVQAS